MDFVLASVDVCECLMHVKLAQLCFFLWTVAPVLFTWNTVGSAKDCREVDGRSCGTPPSNAHWLVSATVVWPLAEGVMLVYGCFEMFVIYFQPNVVTGLVLTQCPVKAVTSNGSFCHLSLRVGLWCSECCTAVTGGHHDARCEMAWSHWWWLAVMFDSPSCTCLVVAGLVVSRFVVAGIVVLVLAFSWNVVVWEVTNVLWKAWWMHWCSVSNIFLRLIDWQWTNKGSLSTKPFPAVWLIFCGNNRCKASAVALVRTVSVVRTLALSQGFPCLPPVGEFKGEFKPAPSCGPLACLGILLLFSLEMKWDGSLKKTSKQLSV